MGPSAVRRAERGIALVAPAMRGVVLVQIVVSATSGARLSSRPGLYLALTLLVVAVSAVLVVQCLRSGSVRAGHWHVPDLVLAWVALPSMNLLLPPESVIGTWESWAAGYAINVAALAATWQTPRVAVVSSGTLGAWVFLWTSAAGQRSWETNLNNALTIPGYAVVVALIAFYLRALAADADLSREDAIAATRALELERYQLTVHDATSILRMLSDEDTPDEVLPGLRRQADREARRLRHYLAGRGTVSPGDHRRTVGSMVGTALVGFEDLPVEPALELGADVELDEPVWAAMTRAVTTLLHNVRLHAEATQVVVHADTDGTSWEVVVSDDGVGFDPERTRPGLGLERQVRQALADVGVTATVRSAPGRGTSVTMVGPVTPTPLDAAGPHGSVGRGAADEDAQGRGDGDGEGEERAVARG